ncbi:Cof-type HAD-IIB family hydrolase [Iocasia frigidifontis]|uniref:Cof-type HAD-IIB family hydrolase n=1 Tax=Iocasia fonsfrigidae TaxID=2682810 RepID=A0A8A7K776_9FIRM|nr:Cof-type HAD-IIB family hydrolase [Iocasia fonsfrigidae]QTL97030.1 Cof-type HAD-IIB family hydrolase [Iocasia fonsfrigidae]
MAYKLLVLDLDDTLLDSEQRLPEQNVISIKKLSKLGVRVVIATGRMFISALPYVKELELKGPVITYNGAFVKDVTLDKVIYHQPMDHKIALRIIKDMEEEGLHINLYQDDQLYVAEENDRSKYYERTAGVKVETVGKISDFIAKPPTKVLIVEKDQTKKEKALRYFREKYGEYIEITESKDYYIEFMARGVSKGKAVERLAGQLGIERSEVIAVGDNWNDLEMIEWAGLGVAMENAPAAVKEKADCITLPHYQAGVSHLIKEIFAI